MDPTNTEPAPPVLPGKFQQQAKEGLHKPPLTMELMDVFQHARSALKINSLDQLHQLAEDLFAEPVLILLKQKQFEECMGLLRQWNGLFGDGDFNLINLLGDLRSKREKQTGT